MKTASVALQAHLAQGQTTLAWMWKLVRRDGTVYGFTTHDLPISYDMGTGEGLITYEAFTGYTTSAQTGRSDLSVDNAEFTGFLISDSLLESEIRAGLFDNATLCVFVVNWSDLTQGHCLVRSGTLGVIKMKNGVFTAEIRGLSHRLTTTIGDTFGPVCRATFGSGLNGIDLNSQWLCMVDVTLYRQAGSVQSVPDATHIVPTAGLLQVGSPTPANPAPANWFADGIVTFTSGSLDGESFDIKAWDGTTLTLFLPLPSAPAHADTFVIEPGCNHTAFDCELKYQNIANLRAENFLPGEDSVLDYPGAGGTVTG